MFTNYLLSFLLVSLMPKDDSQSTSNLISNKMIELDKNLGAFYLNSNVSLSTNSNIYFYFKLDKRLVNISQTIDYEKMGVEISFVDSHNLVKEEKHVIASNTFAKLFDRYDYYFSFKDSFSSSSGINEFKYYPNSNIYSIKLNDDISFLKNISIYYGDNSVNIISAYLGSEIEDIYNIDKLPEYLDDSLSYHLLYADRINYLSSNFGYSISLSYLKRHYRIIDTKNEEIYEIENYYFSNNDNSFLNASIGTRFYLNIKSSNNNIEATIEIKIVDNLSPTIEKWNFDDIAFGSSVFNSLKNDIDNYFYIKDNYSKGDYLQVKISTVNDELISGNYYIYIQVVDQFNNANNSSYLVRVEDKTKPNISSLYSYIVTSRSNPYTSEELLSYFVIEDRESIEEILISENTYLGNEEIPGRYFFEVTAIDKNNNSSSKLIYIEVKDNNASLIKNSYRHFYYSYLEIIDLEEIISILIYDEVIPKEEYTSIKIVEGEDISKPLLPGDYFFLVELESSSGKTYEEIIIHISQKDTNNSARKISFFDFLKTLLKELKNIFINRR